jgi:hypothetical protein
MLRADGHERFVERGVSGLDSGVERVVRRLEPGRLVRSVAERVPARIVVPVGRIALHFLPLVPGLDVARCVLAVNLGALDFKGTKGLVLGGLPASFRQPLRGEEGRCPVLIAHRLRLRHRAPDNQPRATSRRALPRSPRAVKLSTKLPLTTFPVLLKLIAALPAGVRVVGPPWVCVISARNWVMKLFVGNGDALTTWRITDGR